MMQNRGLIIVVVVVALLGFLTIFTVDERERAIKFQLGQILRSDYTPGIYFKIPFVQTVRKFDARIQNIDAEPELYLTSEKKNVKVDSFVKWRVDDVERYYTATGGNSRIASDRLTAVIQKRLKDEFGKRTIFEVVSGERAKIMDILRVSAKDHAEDLGAELIDVRVKRIDLPEDVSSSVYQRMSAERKEVAKDFRSRGEEAAKVIRAKADREREVLLAEADRDAERTRGEGDGMAANIYATAYNRDPEFYRFYRSLNAYRDTFNQHSDILLIQPNTEFFQYFKGSEGKR
ncbi:MAG: protease modulator HflC [Gammaproteobacteria bacterium]|nr:protease modulator HflC [Gammaproteobacteria bacterium]NIR84292.1 protease modulator HflC [Gammaproteobacteria bacterium]NIR89762.1 protease modulator HflC [Gammaproteobacteria bacterium]NIU05450.1 protease modulator HflC [Gammaproteobacteria bacterium]NIV52397.1 protease modulator HflC [Gammaproteobacteria bacterium]